MSVQGSVSGVVTEQSSASAVVELTWSITCAGSGAPTFGGTVGLEDLDIGGFESAGAISTASGSLEQTVDAGSDPRHLQPRLDATCSDQATGHGVAATLRGAVLNVLAAADGGGGGGVAKRGPRAPLVPGGCSRVVEGTNARDTLLGDEGGDLLLGLGKADVLRGERGHDCLVGGAGGDRLIGGPGRDRLTGGAGNDTLVGNGAKNAFDAGSGDDVVKARNQTVEPVKCGAGTDQARVDKGDKLSGCEKVDKP